MPGLRYWKVLGRLGLIVGRVRLGLGTGPSWSVGRVGLGTGPCWLIHHRFSELFRSVFIATKYLLLRYHNQTPRSVLNDA